ncbi:MAG: rod shape-determining protein RodA [Ferrovum sp. 37-45-19]|uniref:rod shape-determining protein RodA n=1 Tax=Ferrovum sp. JA12 TaxID=1356299 RepID=UPI0007028AEB|nr:rod shape-determining protein RodA [Ferrovum sp. JA12]OYV80530.1 MAG: rod shape-determining protein RodA [Ferrovum sp. 21-44-67]OYV94845.1 MAG: rod shape-determining protein RodA [Ferrovum sp. 37-45-19]OZB34122.1 MAG: rod shape-determining protein RodA [Ferrovum sp. 34-44-207]HQT81022.1 rod shape-determining protein RodA [Ferrovaceae bacterium]KRH79253.1 Rod shape-determining protein RodA [Ferrovum sp. JA12]
MIKKLVDHFLKPLDKILFNTSLILMILGLVVLYSASGMDMIKTLGQVKNYLIAFLLMWILATVSPSKIQKLALPIYIFSLALLVAVALFGEVSHGARRWLHLGPLHVQPSEFMKIALPLMLASYFDQRGKDRYWLDFIIAALLLLAPVALVIKQPDLGTALLIASSGFYVILLAGLSWRVLLTLIGGGLCSLPFVWHVLHDYQKQRILTLLDPTKDPLGAGYHTLQSMIALGSGGFLGKGWLHGTQSHLDFLPEHSTDFVFAVFGEEFGLVGECLFLSLMLILIVRGFFIALEGSSPFSRLIAGTLSMTLFTYTFVNLGMVSGILPVVGVPLPFLSYGGTSLVTLFISLGILMSVSYHRQLVKQ